MNPNPSTYSRIVGCNPFADWFLQHLGLRRPDFGRFRDVSLYKDGTSYVVRVLTRNAGSRKQFEPVEKRLARHKLYIRFEIEPTEDTYMYFFFKIPESMTSELAHSGIDLAAADASGDFWLVDNRGLKKKYEEAEGGEGPEEPKVIKA